MKKTQGHPVLWIPTYQLEKKRLGKHHKWNGCFTAADNFISNSNVHCGPQENTKKKCLRKRCGGSSAYLQLTTPWGSRCSGLCSGTCQSLLSQRDSKAGVLSFVTTRSSLSWASAVLSAIEINEPGLCRGSREDGSIAGAGSKHNWCWGVPWKALLDLGWEVWPWPLQLILSVNRPLSSARNQREKCLFCFLDCGSEPVLPHQGLGTSLEVSRLQNASPKLPQMPALVSCYTWIILADWILSPASEWLGKRCVSQSL